MSTKIIKMCDKCKTEVEGNDLRHLSVMGSVLKKVAALPTNAV